MFPQKLDGMQLAVTPRSDIENFYGQLGSGILWRWDLVGLWWTPSCCRWNHDFPNAVWCGFFFCPCGRPWTEGQIVLLVFFLLWAWYCRHFCSSVCGSRFVFDCQDPLPLHRWYCHGSCDHPPHLHECWSLDSEPAGKASQFRLVSTFEDRPNCVGIFAHQEIHCSYLPYSGSLKFQGMAVLAQWYASDGKRRDWAGEEKCLAIAFGKHCQIRTVSKHYPWHDMSEIHSK